MNRIYRLIWNEKAGTFVAVSEIVKSAGRKSSSGETVVGGGTRFALKGLAVSLLLAFGSNVYALPTGGVVSTGSASISTGAGSTTITQSTPNAAINWQSFSIGQTETVRFVQPNSSSITLNRVLGSDPSSILGSLSANGKVFLLNPNGILFGQGAQVNVGGLVASALNITDSDFMAGRYNFSGAGTGTILNQGSINADGGYVALLGANVSNEGVISAKLGTVALAAGNAVTLDVAGDGLLNVTVNQGAVNALVQNGGLIQANGGQVLLTAQAAGNLLQSAVNNTGVIQAQSIENHNGTIRLLGDMQRGTVNVGGTLDVSGTGAGQTGGSVTVTGQHVGLFGGIINASGDAGGGTVQIGGGYQGKNPSIQNASATYVSADSSITADAITNGNGGEVIIWSNDSTRAYGSISARGGVQGGDGGLIETSGHWLDVAGINLSAGAPNGKNGTWLLDPANIIISGAATSGATLIGNVFAPNTNIDDAIVNAGDLQVTLNGGTDVTITTTNTGVAGNGAGDITVNSALTWGTVPGVTLALNAAHDVLVNFAMTASTAGDKIVLTAGHDVKLGAALTASAINTGITLTAGNDVIATAGAAAVTATGLGAVIDMSAGRNVSVLAVTADGGGAPNSVILRAKNDIIVNDAISAAGGNVLLHADSDGTGPGLVGGTVKFVGPGSVAASTNTAIRFNPNGYPATTGEITAYDVLVTGIMDAKAWVFAKGTDKVYDANTTATLYLNGSPAGVTLLPGTADFNTKDVGVNKPITFSGYATGGNVAEYLLWSPYGVVAGSGTTTANITPLTLVGEITAANKPYDANTTATIVTRTLTGVIGVEDVSYSGGSATFSDKNAANGKTVTGTGLSLAGADAGNYTVNSTDTTTANITPLTLVGEITAANKPYDANTTATIVTRTLTGVIGAEDVSYSGGSATFSDKNAANGKTVTGTGLSLAGADAGNYTVNSTDTTTANITPLALVGDITVADKVYNANNSATILTRTLAGPIAGDVVSYTGGSAAFNTPNPGTGKPVTVTGLGLSGADAGNYTVNSTDTTTANIAPILVVPPSTPPVAASPVTPVNWMPTVILASTPPQLLSVAPVLPPPVLLVAKPIEALPVVQNPQPQLLPVAPVLPPPVVQDPPQLIEVPVQASPQLYVAPHYPRKQDRN